MALSAEGRGNVWKAFQNAAAIAACLFSRQLEIIYGEDFISQIFHASVLLAGLPAAAGACLHPSVPLPVSSDAGNVENGGSALGAVSDGRTYRHLEVGRGRRGGRHGGADRRWRRAPLPHTQRLLIRHACATLDSIPQCHGQDAEEGAAEIVPDPTGLVALARVSWRGQIYNRKYWKLPFFYGGFLGCTYAFKWNQQMYRDYSQAYSDIMDDDPQYPNSYLDMLPPRYDSIITGREDRFKTSSSARRTITAAIAT